MSEPERRGNFTKQAIKVVRFAQREAERLQHNYIGTEHLLLGLVRERKGVAAKVLSILGMDLERGRNAVELLMGRGDQLVLDQIELTPGAKKAIELAGDEARQMQQRFIGTEHLLIGLLREGKGMALGVIEVLGISPEEARRRTLMFIRDPRLRPLALPTIPAEAASLVAEGESVLICTQCGARCPSYFRYCFNCGQQLAQK